MFFDASRASVVIMARVLGVHVVNDEATAYCSYWISRILGEAAAAGHEVRQLTGYMVTSYGLLSSIEQYRPDFVILGGHGLPRIFTGAGLQTVLEACVNDGMMAGTQSFFLSCLTGLQLVPSIVKKGGIVASGFVKEYVWMIDGFGNPANDFYAASFERTLVESARVLFQGGSWQDWYSTFKRVSNEEIRRWGMSADPLAASVIFCLRQNASALVVSGAGSMDGAVSGFALLVPIAAVALSGVKI